MGIPRGSPAVPKLAASPNRVCIVSRPLLNSNALRPSHSALQTCSRTDRRPFAGSATRPAAADLAGLKDVLRISDEVLAAVATNKPVVALESTIYTHGAFDEDLGLEEIVRQHGAVPAVCGVYNGVATVGLEKHEIQEMVNGNPAKVSRRDFASIVGDGLRGVKRHGGTTIAGTMILARLAGIRVFGTGGLGGVHRGVESSMDISADLTELGRTRVAVISSGCKGFLDIPRTLEYLETQGVVVATFNREGEASADVTFPAFWARNSGVKSPSHVLSPEDAAYKVYAQEMLGIESGLLLANPIPKDAEIPREVMEDAIERAVRDAERKGYTGSNNTPYILQRIRKYTKGRSVKANLALVRDNVSVAAMVAERLSHILKDGPSAPVLSDGKPISLPSGRRVSVAREVPTSASPVKAKPVANTKKKPITQFQKKESREDDQRADIVVAGSVALDLSCDYTGSQLGAGSTAESPALHTSNPASISQSVGGVGHNVALAAHRFAQYMVKVKLCSVVGDDVAGTTVLEAIRAEGLSTSGIRKLGPEYPGARTAQYVAVNDTQKSLVLAMADMDILTAHPFPKDHWAAVLKESQPTCLVVDANWAPSTIRSLLSVAGDAKTIFEPVSAAKSRRLFEGQKLGVYPNHQVSLATPNMYELSAMYDAAKEQGYFQDVPDWFGVVDRFNIRGSEVDYQAVFEHLMANTSDDIRAAGIPQKVLHLLPYIPSIVVKFGEHGCLLAEIMAPDDERLVMSPEEEEPSMVRFFQKQFMIMRALPGAGDPRVGGVYMRFFESKKRVRNVVSVNGVGDTFLGVLVAGLALGGEMHRLIVLAQKAAVMTLQSKEAVNPMIKKLRMQEWYNQSEDMTPYTGEWPMVKAPAVVQEGATAETVPEVFRVDGRELSAKHAPALLSINTAESSAGDQELAAAQTIPESSKPGKEEEPAQHTRVPSRIPKVLAEMGVPKEQADEVIRAVAIGGPLEFSKWKAGYDAKIAAEKAAAEAKDRRTAEPFKKYAQEILGWVSFAKRGVQDPPLVAQEEPEEPVEGGLSAFDDEVLRLVEEEARARDDTREKESWATFARKKVGSSPEVR